MGVGVFMIGSGNLTEGGSVGTFAEMGKGMIGQYRTIVGGCIVDLSKKV